MRDSIARRPVTRLCPLGTKNQASKCVGWVSDSVTQRIEEPNNQVSSQVGLNAIKLNKQT